MHFGLSIHGNTLFQIFRKSFSLFTARQYLTNEKRNRAIWHGFSTPFSEVDNFAGTVFAFADIVFYRSVVYLGRCIVLEWIRLAADLWFVFRKALVALVDTFDGFVFSFGNDYFHELDAVLLLLNYSRLFAIIFKRYAKNKSDRPSLPP